MKRTCLVNLLLAFIGLSVLGAPPNQDSGSRQKKEPWEWTDSERIAARFSPEFIKANTLPTSSSGPWHVQAESLPTDTVFTIDGSKNPELFFPHELFNFLMNGFNRDSAFRQASRARIANRIVEFGYKDPDAFWAELEQAIAAHLKVIRDDEALYARLNKAARRDRDAIQKEIDVHDLVYCRSRNNALTAARAHFGHDTFDRFLYTAVAPGLLRGSRPPRPDSAHEYTYIEGGCQ